MLRKGYRWFVFVVISVIVISACGGGGSTGGDSPGDGSSETEGSQPSVAGGETVSLVTVSEPGEGTTMIWVDGSTIVHVPEGEFAMGANGLDNPLHTVGLSDFWIQQTEVTNRQYAQCVSNGQCTAPLDAERALALSEPSQANTPVTGVNWEQARAYCTSIQGELPTEAQWEKAARGPESRVYPWGDTTPSCDLLNFDNCSGFPVDVAQFPLGQSYYTLFDMAGNVLEWVYDWYDPNYYNVSQAQDPTGPETGELRGLRSSSYYSFPTDIEMARRLYMEPEKYRVDVGFRCVVAEPQFPLPYCQASAVGVNIPQGSSGSNSASCAPPQYEMGGSFCVNNNSYVNIFVTSGELSSTDKSSLCNYGGDDQAGTEIFTCGPGNTDKSMKICSECTNLPSAEEMVCPAGYTPTGNGNCLFGVDGMESVGGCPAGWTPAESTGGGGGGGGGGGDKGGGPLCVYMGPKPGEHCPIGSYYDPASATCVGNVAAGTPACAPGFIYDEQAQCCSAPTGGSYPGCGPNEYLNENGFCSPLLVNSQSCTDITVSYIDCSITPTKPPSGGDDDTPGGCQQLSCNHPYTWDDALCQCVYNPKP